MKTILKKASRTRRLHFEPLEERALLSVSVGEFQPTCPVIPDLNLSVIMSEDNDIEIATILVAENIVPASAASSISPVANNGILLIEGTNIADWIEIE